MGASDGLISDWGPAPRFSRVCITLACDPFQRAPTRPKGAARSVQKKKKKIDRARLDAGAAILGSHKQPKRLRPTAAIE